MALSCAIFCGGCATVDRFVDQLTGKQEPQTLQPNQFILNPSEAQNSPNGVDAPGQVPENPRLSESFQPVLAPLPAKPPPLPPSQDTPGIAASIQLAEQEVTSPKTQPTTAPSKVDLSLATSEPSASSGQYMPLGGVFGQVNGTPIYVNKVLQLVWPSLHNFAKEYGPEQFAAAAQSEIFREIDVLINSELQFAAAQQNLDDSDKKLVSALTTAYRQKMITEAGGSLELARRRAEANGEDFDEMMEDKYRDNMIFVYLQRKVVPLLAPSAWEMRQYYETHLDKDFTEHSQADFDLLGINPALLNADTAEQAKQMAYDRAKQAHDRLAAGEDFTAVFKDLNNDPGIDALTHSTGEVGLMDRGAFTVKEIDDAVWNLKPGQVSDVINVNGTLYIAKMVKLAQGSVKPFDSEEVQNQIKRIVTIARQNQLIRDEDNRLLSQAIYPTHQQMQPTVDTAVDMAMRSYRIWNQK
jgi:parvulin-like peptidyl-prolyl isomerase